MVTPYCQTDLQSLLRFSPSSLGGDWHLRVLLHQLLHALAALHAQGLALGGFCADQLLLLCPGWLALLAKPAGTLLIDSSRTAATAADHTAAAARVQKFIGSSSSTTQLQPWQQQQQQQQQVIVIKEPWYSLPQLTELWRLRSISNLEYLMWLNAAAGRVWGDRRRHPLVPWVIDFSVRPDLQGAVGRVFRVNVLYTRRDYAHHWGLLQQWNRELAWWNCGCVDAFYRPAG
jgi:WD repeat-containing protein 81